MLKATQSIGNNLLGGVLIPDEKGRTIRYRYVTPTDDRDEITAMLHEAYEPLAKAGMRYVASDQDATRTKRRMDRGETVVALDGDLIVGIITLADADKTAGSSFYDRADVASFGQFAVRPSHQTAGIGRTLLDLVERRGREHGLTALGLDTSEHATRLIALYERRGYAFIEYAQWPEVNYRSVILGKTL